MGMTEEREYKHYNAGAIVGVLAEFTEKLSDGSPRIPYLQMQFECASDIYGSVKAYARFWGRKKIDAFLDFHKKNPGQVYNFRGFFSQYDKESEGRRLSNYTVYEWAPTSSREFLASFILKGRVTAAEKLESEGKIHLHLVREGANRKTVEEWFEVYTMNAQDIDGLDNEAIIEAKGFLRAKSPFDAYGMPSTDIRPFIMELKILGRKEPF
jgi:hypothetical protein